MGTSLTSAQVVALTGITPRQLQWWDERGIVMPHRQGHRRLYSREDVAEIAVICELRQRGFSLQRVRRVIHFLQQEFGKRLYESARANARIHLLTDGNSIFIKVSPDSIIDVLRNARQPLLAVCLSDTVRRLQAGIRINSKAAGAQAEKGRRAVARTARARNPALARAAGQ
ncbi:MAG: MerR family transcriptional regulator [Candidatus Korobacteraceae bacterium]|jgi:DNA-binding transcriptional MerR regulator